MMLLAAAKFVDPSRAVPRFTGGVLVFVSCLACLWHSLTLERTTWILMGSMGEGGGLFGAYVSWLLSGLFGQPVAVGLFSFGLLAGLCMALGKPAWTPLSFLWSVLTEGWWAFVEILEDFFRPTGPSPEDVESFREEQTSDLESPQEQEERSTGEAAVTARGAIPGKRLRPGRPGPSGYEERETEVERDWSGFSGPGSGTRSSFWTQPDANKGRFTGVPQVDTAGQRPESVAEQVPLSDVVFYELPPLSLLDKPQPVHPKGERDIQDKARIIEETLASFGIKVKVVNFSRGPAVTRFELQPAPGTKVSAIVNRSQDIALALAAPDVRIEAPIPGKAAVGIEVPNREVSLVHLREVLESPAFRESNSPLTIALGKDISGKPVVTTLDHAIHLLIAGATGSGKSVCINSIIASILYKARPDQVKLLLIDPKRVELTAWSSIPHLVAPVVYDPRKAAGALRWAIKEMQSRYEAFARFGVRDIEKYNQVATPPGSPRPALPYIVIIVDELSDLMVVAPAEVEDSIFRLAQMSRAAGIHLVLATQRPSVDVLTGTIKANIPSRIAFAVSSQIDSRTILDVTGAEKLLGRGDMLFMPVGAVRPIRAQGTYISEREIDELVSFTSRQARPQYAPGILQEPESEAERADAESDPLFTQALRIVVEARQASVSLLQRKLPIGYSRAARLIDAMERRGFVGPYEGSKPREVKLTIQQYLRMFENQSQPERETTRDQRDRPGAAGGGSDKTLSGESPGSGG
ncbi:MAG: DNA translocase FtsK [Firmicutes bacterium]|nr:DNA translocase FtsK [Candidatus Fermentithermobacillaceae bacterium]